jgi:hypothetical protein
MEQHLPSAPKRLDAKWKDMPTGTKLAYVVIIGLVAVAFIAISIIAGSMW